VVAFAAVPTNCFGKGGKRPILTVCRKEANGPPLSRICIQVSLSYLHLRHTFYSPLIILVVIIQRVSKGLVKCIDSSIKFLLTMFERGAANSPLHT